MPPAAMASSVRRPMCRAWAASGPPRRARRRHSSTSVGRGNLGAGPKPPHSGSKPAAIPATTCSTRTSVSRGTSAGVPARRRQGSASAAALRAARLLAQGLGQAQFPPHGADQRVGLLEHLGPLVGPGVAERLHDPAEGGHPVALDGWEVGPGVEGPPIGRAEDRHGPAPGSGQGLGGRHVDGIEVGTLLAVDLHRNERLRQVSRRVGILEALVRHDVAPVARGVPDGHEEGLVLVAGPLQGLVPQGNHCTGLSACWRRYGLVSSARWFTGAMLRLLHRAAAHRRGRARLRRWSSNSTERRR